MDVKYFAEIFPIELKLELVFRVNYDKAVREGKVVDIFGKPVILKREYLEELRNALEDNDLWQQPLTSDLINMLEERVDNCEVIMNGLFDLIRNHSFETVKEEGQPAYVRPYTGSWSEDASWEILSTEDRDYLKIMIDGKIIVCSPGTGIREEEAHRIRAVLDECLVS